MRTLIVSSLGQVVESVGGLVQVEPGGLAPEMTHWREASLKVNEVQDPAADFKHRLAQSIGFLSTLTGFATVIVCWVLNVIFISTTRCSIPQITQR